MLQHENSFKICQFLLISKSVIAKYSTSQLQFVFFTRPFLLMSDIFQENPDKLLDFIFKLKKNDAFSWPQP